MTAHPRIPSPLTPVDDERFARRGVRLLLKRDDLIHPDLVGNKWRKLLPNLAAARGRALVTFGGAYSNHLRATAAAGRLLGLPTIGVVRGHELAERPLNASLTRCAADGMRLHFVDRTTYRRKTHPDVLATLLRELDVADACVIPEGGSNAQAVRGCVALGQELRGQADVVAVACGTGGTLAGLAAGLDSSQRALGVPVLKGDFLNAEIRTLQEAAFGGPRGTWWLDERFHFGGYARTDATLEDFAEDFENRHRQHDVPDALCPSSSPSPSPSPELRIERLYVAKLLYGLVTLTEEDAFAPGTTVAAVITGRPFPDEDRAPAQAQVASR
ncbi:1-aminocyclopropane-1-carboxylate deaminase/D-cysteine desulfhydrase [Streptomyces odontomachi]|uniref:1-aminocyclopropane-1-carboxylate deaminase/D-cysteine desulfhydrase n=1 Tax=Streptomyces odontomachi TaxID=2944940 RepID=UPI0021090954|nr:pyridoxal-phosphate dependent enzyme [Streptomyces sp. ODS25]